MKKLQRPFNVLKKHLLEHHNLTFNSDLSLLEQEKDVFCFERFFFNTKVSIYGIIDVHRKEIVYEIGDYERKQGKGFVVFSTINSKLETITY